MVSKKQKNLSISLATKLLVLIFVVIAVLLLIISGNKPKAKSTYISKYPATVPTITIKQDILNSITFTHPENWNDNIAKPWTDYLEFTTPDYEEGYSTKGAKITILKSKVLAPLHDRLTKWVQNPAGPGAPKPEQLKFLTINGKEAVYYPVCWEGCTQEYIIINGDQEYKFSFACGTSPSCNKAEEISSTQYYPAFISLIQSVKFK